MSKRTQNNKFLALYLDYNADCIHRSRGQQNRSAICKHPNEINRIDQLSVNILMRTNRNDQSSANILMGIQIGKENP